ncbi:Uma2 family endonuclease [Geminocystis sp. CENA526]|uniref:Uma2 family endonuclease n=1 Tax=Geminocystis sp. CENA526 TaxID=1355871 RepID=UPI003D6EE2AE
MILTAQQLADLMPNVTQLESDEPEMESSEHYTQLLLLVSCLEWLWKDENNFFIGANLTIYFSRQQLKNRDFRGPDFFLVKNTEKKPRKSWVVWEEDGKYPDLIIELLSDSTANIDRTLKKQLYQDHFGTSEYFWFSPETMELEGYRLKDNKYQPIIPDENNFYWSESLGLFLGIYEEKLRYFSIDRKLIPTPEESALQAQAEAFQAQAQALQAQTEALEAKQRVSQLEAKLRELGIDF